ncbi:MAG: Holliday junction branch migration protein RuvA [Rickettsiales bacterium]|jgi:Holliday junction DNA helicase RuvA|nr:Holliday junction branch migration protein RuvA [Rickettsiales bacterium]
MIGKLKGKIDLMYEEYIILDVGGVGYRVFCSGNILRNHSIGEHVTLFINTIVREDAILLFGFLNENEKKWFDILCKISGIGGKMALKIMGTMSVNDIIRAIDIDDAKAFCNVPGVGKKIADRIIVELKNIRKNLTIDNETIGIITGKNADNNMVLDAISALENLGYQRGATYNVITNILKERDDIVLESLITETLKRLNKL